VCLFFTSKEHANKRNVHTENTGLLLWIRFTVYGFMADFTLASTRQKEQCKD